MSKVAVFILVLLCCNSVFASDLNHVVCTKDGMAGVKFGQTIDEANLKIDEKALSGVTYFLYEPQVDIAPYNRLIVGVTPKSRKVFSIRLEMQGKKKELQKVLHETKTAIQKKHPNMLWSVIDDNHDAEKIDNLSLSLYIFGDVLTIDCDHLKYRSMVRKETRY